jgi:choice-of-anchor B domain-containing protein
MKFNSIIATAALGATTVTAAAGAASKMEKVMEIKTKQWEEARANGLFGGSALYPKLKQMERCRNGKAGEYKCNNVNMHSFLSHEDMGSKSLAGNDIWGWTSKWGREFGIVGQTDGVAFVEINRLTGWLTYLGRLDTQTEVVSWRDIKVIGDYAYIGSEAEGHGLQIFDLNKLLEVKDWWNPWFKPKTFSKEKDITLFTGFGASHNIVAHEEVNMIYAVGGRSGANARNTTCAGGFFMVDVSNPKKPVSPGCVGQDGYVHDAQCVIYKGPSKKFTGREICFAFNEDTLTVMDMTDKKNPIVVSRTPYVGNAYSHQGWLVDESMKYLLLDDELDEVDQVGPAANGHTTTYVFNIADLENPINTGYFQSPARSIDHNQYIIDGLSYQANYGSGLRIVDVSSIRDDGDPTGGSVEEVGFFDCHPEDGK